VYLGHFLFSSLAYRLISPAWMAQSSSHAVAGGAVLTVVVIVASSITYYMVERPSRRWLGGRSS
jgi:peptidoglycan/LPS O-acetylase OafA/YrhL